MDASGSAQGARVINHKRKQRRYHSHLRLPTDGKPSAPREPDVVEPDQHGSVEHQRVATLGGRCMGHLAAATVGRPVVRGTGGQSSLDCGVVVALEV